MDKKRNVITMGGAFVAFVMGSGFASGQEIMQFFSAFGLLRSITAGAVAMLVFVWIATTVIVDGRGIVQDSSCGIYSYYCGNKIGALFEWLMPLIMFLFLIVMISGAGAAFYEYYGISEGIGRAIMCILAFFTVLLGLSGLVRIIGSLGIIIIFVIVAISFVSIFKNIEGLVISDQVLEHIYVPRASFVDSWWISGLLYSTFNMVTTLPFLAGLGKEANNKEDAFRAGAFGAFAYIAGAILVNLALLSSIAQVYDKQIPFIPIASSLFPWIGAIFSVMLLAGIYTTAAPMLWSICNLIGTEEKSLGYRLIALFIIILAYIGSQLPFGILVGIIYPATGILGMLLLVCMLYKKYIKRK
ncbi:MAG: hypothetical protein ACOX4P_03100 [Anaerovoracaceae bacterium]|jgi:uncharacterized membrane protein YkvI